MYFRVVQIYDNNVNRHKAHMIVEPGTASDPDDDDHWPHVPGAGIGGYLSTTKVGPSYAIVMPQKFNHDGIFGGSNPDKGAY